MIPLLNPAPAPFTNTAPARRSHRLMAIQTSMDPPVAGVSQLGNGNTAPQENQSITHPVEQRPQRSASSSSINTLSEEPRSAIAKNPVGFPFDAPPSPVIDVYPPWDENRLIESQASTGLHLPAATSHGNGYSAQQGHQPVVSLPGQAPQGRASASSTARHHPAQMPTT